MKQAFILTILALLIISSISFVSAKTMIAGKIYNADYSDTIAGADVEVTCNGNTESRLSGDDGTYGVSFYTNDCNTGNIASVYAICVENQCTETNSGNTIVGENTVKGTVYDEEVLGIDVNLAIVNVPLIPEFGLFVGALTIVSAVGIFFFVRRK